MSKIEQIPESFVKMYGVQTLPDRPNSLGLYGEGGLSPKELKLAFDRLATEIINQVNGIISNLQSAGGAENIGVEYDAISHVIITLDAFLKMLNNKNPPGVGNIQKYKNGGDLVTVSYIAEGSVFYQTLNSALSNIFGRIKTAETFDESQGELNESQKELNESQKELNESQKELNESQKALNKELVSKISIDFDESTYKIKFVWKNADGETLGDEEIDLPIEFLVDNARYDDTEKKLYLIFKGGTEVGIDISELVTGLVTSDTLDGVIDTLDGKIDTLDGKIDTLDGKIDTLDGEIVNLSQSDTTIINRLNDNDLRLGTITSDLGEIKSNTKDIPEKIGALEEKVATLEDLTLTYTEDLSTAYTKVVPSLVARKAIVSEIGGMTYKVTKPTSIIKTNVINGEYDGITVTTNEDGSYTVNGYARDYVELVIWQPSSSESFIGRTTTISWKGKVSSEGETYLVMGSENWIPEIEYLETRKSGTVRITWPEEPSGIYLQFYAGAVVDNARIYVWMNEGSEALDYEITSLIDSKVTAIEDYGANLYNGEQEISCNGTDIDKTIFKANITDTVTFSFKAEGTANLLSNAMFEITQADGTAKYSALQILNPVTLNGCQRIKIVNWAQLTGKVFNIMLNYGDTAVDYKPYRQPITYPIPEAIQEIPGYGMTDTTIWFSDKKATQLCAKGTFLPNMNWLTNNEYDDYISFYILKTELNPAMLAAPSNVTFEAAGYEVIPYSSTLTPDAECVWNSTVTIGIFISKSNLAKYGELTDRITKINTFKAWLTDNPVEILYELAEPITTDIPVSLEGFDGLIEVEGGGMLKFVNEHENAVPSAVAYVTRRRDD
jgi:prefoldin subunit 5